ncbi:MAG: PorT family protein [Crocinitomicaceae bacterium]|nr:PorT family protein [Crocinitomicaceae bacterium]
MKTTITLFTLLICANLGLAQKEENNKPDTTRFNIGNTEFIIIDNDTIRVDKDNGDIEDPDDENEKDWANQDLAYWSGFEVGVNMLMNNQFEPDFQETHLQIDPANSFVFNFNLFEYFLKFGTPHVGLVTGLGFTNSRFGFKDSYMRLGANADSTFGYADSTLINGFEKNQLRVNYVNIPLLIQFNTSKNKKKNFHIAVGAIGGVRMSSKMKYKYDVGEGTAEDKTKGRFNVNPFHASLTARIGYRGFGLFASYNMLPLFENDKSRVAKPLTFGASLHF